MKTERVNTPRKAREKNGSQLMDLGCEHGLIGISQAGCPCETCLEASADSHFFSTALIVVGAAAVQNRAADLYEVLVKFAQSSLEDFPADLRGSLYGDEIDFPEIIHEAEESKR